MNSLIRAIERNTAKRKKIKNRIDSEINLSVESDVESVLLSARSGDTNRLIDEGAIIEGDGSVWGYIKKGTLEKFMNGENVYLDNLSNDFVGYINIGHLDHATFPFPVGEWRKEDMTLVDIGDGRQGIDMNNSTIDRDSMFIKELERLGLELSESIEAQFHLDYEASEDLGFPVYDEILIYGYAVVGDGKNVNSNGLRLKGEKTMAKDTKKLAPETEVDVQVELENVDEVTEQITEVEETIEATVEAETVEAEEEVEATDEALSVADEEEVNEEADEADEADTEEDAEEEVGEEDEVEEIAEEDADDDENEVDEADELTEAISIVKDLKAQIAELTNINAELKKTNRKLSNRLASEKEKKAKFLESTKNLSVELLPNEAEEQKEKANEIARLEAEKQYKYGDGIADI